MTLPAWLMELVPAVPALPEPVPEQVPTEKHQEIHNVKPYVPAVPDVPAQKQSLRECGTHDQAALVVECYTPAGDMMLVEAHDADHAAWLRRVNTKTSH